MAICDLVGYLIGDDLIEVPVASKIAGTAGDPAKLVGDATVRPSRIVNGQIPQGPTKELVGIEVSANDVLFLGEDSHSIRLQVSARADGRVGGGEIAIDKEFQLPEAGVADDGQFMTVSISDQVGADIGIPVISSEREAQCASEGIDSEFIVLAAGGVAEQEEIGLGSRDRNTKRKLRATTD